VSSALAGEKTSADTTATAPPSRPATPSAGLAAFARARWAPLVFWLSVAVTAALFFAGAWERRWIADDGLIVLRTVRNMLAGNGPVFNAGERVEANTSTLWTFLIYAMQRVMQLPQIEIVALIAALSTSLLAIVFAMWGARIMWAGTLRNPGRLHGRMTAGVLMLPFGTLVYIVLPPAKDFATSGLETGLVIAWIALCWFLAQRWARAPHSEFALGFPGGGTVVLAVVAGLGPLVRPEMAIVAAALLALVFFSRQSILHRVWLVVLAGAIPVVYQVWRMSYYGLPYPNTAVAKDAGGSKWGQGLSYLGDLAQPYVLVLPAVVGIVAIAAAAYALRSRVGGAGASSSEAGESRAVGDREVGREGEGLRGLVPPLRSTSAVTALFVIVGLVLAVYSVRVGGDFMHGRVLLPPLFTLLLPIAVLPIPVRAAAVRTGGDPGESADPAEIRRLRILAPVLAVCWLVVAGWALAVTFSNQAFPEKPESITSDGIVDERAFYLQRTGHKNPLLARDYLDFPRMRELVQQVRDNQTGAVFLPVGGAQDRWDVVALDHPLPGLQPFETPEDPQKTVVFLNLGMTSMNLPLDVRVLDTVGLSNPLAAHTDRMVDGRIGHDKYLPLDWFLADSGLIENLHNLPEWADPDWYEQAKVALTCPATVELRKSYMDPLTPERRKANLKNAFAFAEYRINRIPAYEVQRCGLPMPPEVDLDAIPR